MFIRSCTDADMPAIVEIINDAAQIYHGAIPDDCWHTPYMPHKDLTREIAAGVTFQGIEDSGKLAGVMGLQKVKDVALIRHAYVSPDCQGKGIGGLLLADLIRKADAPLLVGTWAAAEWAIRFYERHGFKLTSSEEKDRLLQTYWNISPRQRETSVVMALAN